MSPPPSPPPAHDQAGASDGATLEAAAVAAPTGSDSECEASSGSSGSSSASMKQNVPPAAVGIAACVARPPGDAAVAADVTSGLAVDHRTQPDEAVDVPVPFGPAPSPVVPVAIAAEQTALPTAVAPHEGEEEEVNLLQSLQLRKPKPQPGKISFSLQGAKSSIEKAQSCRQAEEAVEAARAKRLNTRDASTQTVRDPEQDGDIVTIWRLRPRGMESFPHFPRPNKKRPREALICVGDAGENNVTATRVAGTKRRRGHIAEAPAELPPAAAALVPVVAVAESSGGGAGAAGADAADEPGDAPMERQAMIEALRAKFDDDEDDDSGE